ncbi:MAG: hypothetical protein IJ081_02865 [Prevotella sp.]|nr:hypothetical protein [Prevotella sp.]
MKKIYMIPTTTTTQIELQNLMTLSSAGIDTTSETIETQTEEAITDGMSRSTLWDDEE